LKNKKHQQSTHIDFIIEDRNSNPIYIICDEVSKPVNIGAVFRLADAASIEKVIFICSEKPENYTKIDKVARSTRKTVPYVFCNRSNLYESLPGNIQMIALEITNQSTSFRDYIPQSPVALILGNENHGVSDYLLTKCSQAIHIPMLGQNSSMNVVMAATIIVYDWIAKIK